jgi:tRNA(adenine34) deaminase
MSKLPWIGLAGKGRMLKSDKIFIRQVLDLGAQAAKQGDVPIGALVVDPYGQVLGTGYNQVEYLQTQTAHAEMIALAAASQQRGDWRLDGCTLYVTLQPCYMCWPALALSRIHRLVYATASPVFGFDPDQVDPLPSVYRQFVQYVQEGPCTEQARKQLEDFFSGCRLDRSLIDLYRATS